MIPTGGAPIAQHGVNQLWSKIGRPVACLAQYSADDHLERCGVGLANASHLATMGFCVLRVRSNLVEIRLVLDR
jgi:hypothetical protein